VLTAAIVWPLAARAATQGRVRWLALLPILVVSVSRVYLGVHFISDVVAAWALAAGLHPLFGWVERNSAKWLAGVGLWRSMGIALGAALISPILGAVVKAAMAGTPDPASWAEFSETARNLDGICKTAGAFFGAACGIVMAARWARFGVRGPFWRRCAAFGCVLIASWGIRRAARIIHIQPPENFKLILDFVVGAAVSWWLLFLAPWLLLKAGFLAPPAEPEGVLAVSPR
jgi:hypothetical protein